MTTMRNRTLILALLATASLTAFAAKEESVDVLIARAESVQPNDRPALYLKIADLKAAAADKLYDNGNPDAAKTTLQDVVTYSQKATDAAIATGKKLKNVEITLRKMSEKFRDIKRTVAFDDQAPLQQTADELEKMRTDLLSAMFGKKKGK
jgi:hypothetical protein